MGGPFTERQATEVTTIAVDDKGKSARLHHLSAGPAKREADEPASPSTPAVSFLEPLATPSSTGLRSTTAFDDEEGTRSSAEEEDEDLRDGTTVLPLEDNENRRSFRRPGTPPFSPSQSSFRTDRLSVQSTTVTDFSDCSPSPSPSIGSVRMAQITKIPHRPYAPPTRRTRSSRPSRGRPGSKLLERKSLDMLTTMRVTFAASDAPVVTSAPTHGRSFSTFTRRSAKSDERNKERDEALRGLGLNIGLPNGLAASESKRSLKSVFSSSSPPLPHSDSYPDVGAASLAAYAGKVRPAAARSESSTKATRAAKNLAPVVFDSKRALDTWTLHAERLDHPLPSRRVVLHGETWRTQQRPHHAWRFQPQADLARGSPLARERAVGGGAAKGGLDASA
ncbi:hypothetical protein AAT19DRAFT_13056 [Rhodotorula toruloides]|uniref:Proteophosphoglycan ppg4 n=1 Tax=Rhodotorula toruloides TaxID=5286 RepID=A0A2T0ADG8_RHOTO|nr:hypothetical protein AAT19DRAFT_13056 [Rhodotorula toruloides]